MISAVLLLLLGLLVIAVIIVANGYFVAQEFAYMSVDRTELRARADQGDEQAHAALGITQRTSFMLSGAQLGITVTGLLVGFVAEPLVGEAIGQLLGGTGIPVAVSVAIGTTAALALSTIVQMIFGELFPKNYTIAAPMKSSLALAKSTKIYLLIFGPLIKFFDASSNALLKAVGIEPVEDVDSTATAEDLGHIVANSKESGDLDDHTFLVLDRLLDFPDHDVEHAMIPRSRTDVVDPETSIQDVRRMMATQHTRYPVIDDEHSPVGVVHLIDVLDHNADAEAPVKTIMRDPVVLTELMSLPDAVTALQNAGEKLACVIDEYGGFIGIITVEDLAEEILGDVTDEHDQPESEDITITDEDEWLVEGDTPIDEIERAIGHELPEGDFETVSGLILSHAGALVEEGEVHEIPLEAEPEDYVEGEDAPTRQLRVEIHEIDRNVPAKVHLELVETKPEEEEK